MLNGLPQQRTTSLPTSKLATTIAAIARMKPFALTTVIVAISLNAGNALAAGDDDSTAKPARPVADLVTVCASCHGQDGKGINETIPNLGGQHRDYLAYSLKAYQTGNRDNAIMKGMVIELTNEEIASLANYYARQEDTVFTPSRSTWLGD